MSISSTNTDLSTIMPSELTNISTSTTNEIEKTNFKQTEEIMISTKAATISKAINQEALDALVKRTGYPLVQENGQRRYGPPPDWDSTTRQEPDRGCEVFVGKIPRDCFEDELVPVLEKVGYVYEFRLMMEYSGYNRGYGFVMYTCREDAKKAVLMLNNYEIRKGRMIGLCRSVDNCRLFVGGIPKNKKREEILEEMKKVTDDVINVIVYPSANDKSKNRGFAFVQYGSHRAAAVARRKLIPNRISLFGQPIAVDWAEPEPEVDEDVMAAVKVLYVRNLMLSTTEEKIKAEFEKLKEGSVERVKKMKDFAFVHFKEREDALNAMKIMNGSTIDDAVIEVTLSKPIDKSNYLKLQQNVQANPLIVTGLGENELNLLIGAPMINPAVLHPASAASATATPTPNQLINIPLTYPDANLQFHLQPATNHHSIQPHHSIQQIPLSALAATTAAAAAPLNIPNFSQFTHPIAIATQNQFIQNVAAATTVFNPTDFNSIIQNGYQTVNASAAATAVPPPPQPILQPNPTVSPQNKSNSTSNRNVLRSSPRHVVNGAHRSTYYNVANKNGTFVTSRKQSNNEDLLYDYYSGIKPVPMLPINMPTIKYSTKSPIEVLEEICSREGLSPPVYTLHTTSGYEPDGKEIGLFLYKVTVPSLFGTAQLSSNRLMRSIEEAKHDSAEFVLTQIYSNPHLLLLQQQQQQQQQQNKKSEDQTAKIDQQTTSTDSKSSAISAQTFLHQQVITPLNSQYSDHINEYQQIIPAQQYIIDPTGQYLVCQTSE